MNRIDLENRRAVITGGAQRDGGVARIRGEFLYYRCSF